MSTEQAALSQGRTNRALAILFFGMFALGCAELLAVGLLNLIAAGLQVSVPRGRHAFLAHVTGITGGPVSVFLLAYGAATAVGSFGGGVAIGDFTASAPIITGLIIAVIGIMAAWATSFLRPTPAGKVPGLTAAAEPASEAA